MWSRMNDIARRPAYPGFHSLPLIEVSMNKDKWDALPADLQDARAASVNVFRQTRIDALKERDLAAVEKARASGSITVDDWPPEERAKFRTIARGEWEKVGARSDMARKVYDQLNAYLTSKGLIQQAAADAPRGLRVDGGRASIPFEPEARHDPASGPPPQPCQGSCRRAR